MTHPIDERCITSLVRDEMGNWRGEALYKGTRVDCSWDACTDDELASERTFAVRNLLDNLRVTVVRELIAEGCDGDVDDGDLTATLRSARRIGDDDVEGVVAYAYFRGLLVLRSDLAEAS